MADKKNKENLIERLQRELKDREDKVAREKEENENIIRRLSEI